MVSCITPDPIEYDEQIDALYLYLKRPIAPGEAAITLEVSDYVYIDFNENRQPLGIDIINAKKVLGVAGKPQLEAIVQAVTPHITAAMQTEPQYAQPYQRVLDLLH